MSLPTASAISLSMCLENNSLSYDSVHTSWGMLTLHPTPLDTSNPLTQADFVLAVDISASVNAPRKLAFIREILFYLLSQLDENQTFSFICFNQEVNVWAELRACTPENKRIMVALSQKLELSGSTNLSGAISAGTAILKKRSSMAQNRISTIMVFTEWGLAANETVDSNIAVPNGCSINTFGFGSDHDSKLLNSIALKSQGCYYYVDQPEDLSKTFGNCVKGILSTRAHQIDIRLTAQDGARMVAIATPFKIRENQVAKDYNVKLAMLSAGESKSVLFRLSLRAMQNVVNSHHLLRAEVNYTNTLTGKSEILMANISVIRPAIRVNENIPIILDEQINRYSAATTISESIELSNKLEFILAQIKLKNSIEQIQRSASAHSPFCTRLIEDLLRCQSAMNDSNSYHTHGGVHIAHECASIYFMERNPSLFKNWSLGYKHPLVSGPDSTWRSWRSSSSDNTNIHCSA